MPQKKKVSQGKEILWNIINSALAGGLVFLGSLSTGEFQWKSICLAVVASLVVAVTRFKDYWTGQEGEYTSHLFRFV